MCVSRFTDTSLHQQKIQKSQRSWRLGRVWNETLGTNQMIFLICFWGQFGIKQVTRQTWDQRLLEKSRHCLYFLETFLQHPSHYFSFPVPFLHILSSSHSPQSKADFFKGAGPLRYNSSPPGWDGCWEWGREGGGKRKRETIDSNHSCGWELLAGWVPRMLRGRQQKKKE